MTQDELKYLIFVWNIKNFSASANSKILFIKVEESIEIFFTIFHFGCLRASLGLIFLNFNTLNLKKVLQKL